MKYRILFILVFLPFLGFSQERGVGIRLGEPFSITYKDFLEDYLSYEVMVGSGGVNGSNYYQRSFENNPPNSNAFYLSHAASRGVNLNFRMALHEDITDTFEITEGYLLGYAGAGVQLRTTRVNYAYQPGLQTVVLTEERTNLDIGPEAFAGAEYYFDETPISVFVEVGMFLELIDRINVKGQGGIGVRYLF
ncbi:hypothetical protein [Algoriphagus boritolerans]|uniref:Outer membrane protein beta-barrel domain-containing protein n=1 Tax=Algoriphagus boritolerans DSM 17298 = JCM 18970 TaxID=1120964 RepID=A0A1H5VUV7_9BACT|nr:hypothetical protein [Algoriphagus boritolerans]SEF91062.1 hypothetical protein SAMN03080598_01818 [Algoriphagus boritolerans DSM 17298 = JCM 18970]